MKGFVLDRAEVAEGGVAPPGVVPALDPLEHRRRELGAAGPGAAVEKLALHGRPERLDEGVVDAGGDAAHGTEQPGGAKPVTEEPRRVLRASVRMHDRAGLRARCQRAICSASTTSSVRMWSAIDQPTTLRE